MTKAPRSKRPKSGLSLTAKAVIEILDRHRDERRAEMKRLGLAKFDPSRNDELGVTLDDWRAAMFDALSLPLVAAEVKKIAYGLGITVEVYLFGRVAEGFRAAGQPLPPDLREYLAQQELPPAMRERYLKPGLS
jgi:hypothetical protein